MRQLPSSWCGSRGLAFETLMMITAALCIRITVATPVEITIDVPSGSTTHNDPNLLCLPATRYSIIAFFFGNYFAHAVTVRSVPGAPLLTTVLNVLFALVMPASGMIRGIDFIGRLARFAPNAIQTAARSGALCVVVRNKEWRPVAGQKIYGARFTAGTTGRSGRAPDDDEIVTVLSDPNRMDFVFEPDLEILEHTDNCEDDIVEIKDGRAGSKSDAVANDTPTTETETRRRPEYAFVEEQITSLHRRVHGSFCLPPGYSLRILRGFVKANVADSPQIKEPELSASYSPAKSFAAILQTVLGVNTLLQTRGGQINQFGYAAFGLTVIPYVIASVTNLVSNLITPEYPMLYLVRSEVMDEAESVPGDYFVDGVVGSIKQTLMEGYTILKVCSVVDNDAGDDKATGLGNHTFQFQVEAIVPGPTQPNTAATGKIYDGLYRLRERHSEIEGQETDAESPGIIVPACGNYEKYQDSMFLERPGDVKLPGQSIGMKIIRALIFFIEFYILLFLPLTIIGGMSGFHKKGSTLAQRVWTICWLIFGQIFGYFGAMQTLHYFRKRLPYYVGAIALLLVFPIGGFVTVGQMIVQYGDCRKLR